MNLAIGLALLVTSALVRGDPPMARPLTLPVGVVRLGQ